MAQSKGAGPESEENEGQMRGSDFWSNRARSFTTNSAEGLQKNGGLGIEQPYGNLRDVIESILLTTIRVGGKRVNPIRKVKTHVKVKRVLGMTPPFAPRCRSHYSQTRSNWAMELAPPLDLLSKTSTKHHSYSPVGV